MDDAVRQVLARARRPGERPVAAGALGVGVLAGVVLPFRDLGLGTFVVLLAAGGVILAAACTAATRSPWPAPRCACCWPRPTLLRDAEWIVVLCLLAGARSASCGVVSGRTLPGFVLAGIAWPLAGLRGLPVARPVAPRRHRPRQQRGRAAHRRLVASWGCSSSALLFASADALFAEWVGRVVPDLDARTRSCCGRSSPSPSAASCWRRRTSPSTRRRSSRPAARRVRWRTATSGWRRCCSSTRSSWCSCRAGHGDLRRARLPASAPPGSPMRSTSTRASASSPWRPRSPCSSSGRRPARHRARRRRDLAWLRGSLGLLCAADAGRGRLRALPDARLPGGLRLHPAPPAGRRLRGLARAARRSRRARGGRHAARGLAAARRAAQRRRSRCSALAALNPDAWIAERNLDRYAETGKVDWAYLREPLRRRRAGARRRCPTTWSRARCWVTTAGRRRLAGVEPRPRTGPRTRSPRTWRAAGRTSRPASAWTSGSRRSVWWAQSRYGVSRGHQPGTALR